MTDGATRRIELMNRLKQENRPLSGTELAKEFGVSRQVIVQDIALLRATNRNILSTNKGYVLYDPEHGQNLCRRIFAVNHTDAQMQEELYLMVDCGGYVCDVIVEHEIYGQLSADLILKKYWMRSRPGWQKKDFLKINKESAQTDKNHRKI